MKKKEKLKELLKKSQKLSKRKKEAILILIVAILALILGYVWLKQTKQRLEEFRKEDLRGEYNISSIKKEIEKNFQEINLPDIGIEKERVERLRKLIEENPEEAELLLERIKQDPEKTNQLIEDFEKSLTENEEKSSVENELKKE